MANSKKLNFSLNKVIQKAKNDKQHDLLYDKEHCKF